MSTTNRTPLQVVQHEVERWATSYDELRASFRDLLGDEGEYLCQQDMPLLRGADQALEAITGFHEGFGVETIEVDWVEIEQVGNTVWNERVDHMVDAAGERFLAIPIAGFFRFDDAGTLTAWRDYWDMRKLLALAPEAT
ncbi:limonene-1,2-epoxide hydrolase family protein [Patulibacter minatonensis]|uniref:limonene-1,2-epoxide hydrolase family protein n=1 Tax=Patulibacter minatonensis TaxID=298163 RepID=UPI0004B90708|nr:limonene-1,2-epoxide hydrolase family protein [Patulibacter minatonensis]